MTNSMIIPLDFSIFVIYSNRGVSYKFNNNYTIVSIVVLCLNTVYCRFLKISYYTDRYYF